MNINTAHNELVKPVINLYTTGQTSLYAVFFKNLSTIPLTLSTYMLLLLYENKREPYMHSDIILFVIKFILGIIGYCILVVAIYMTLDYVGAVDYIMDLIESM